MLFLTNPFTARNKKETIYCTVKRNLALYTQNYFTYVSKNNQICVLKEETGGRGFSPQQSLPGM